MTDEELAASFWMPTDPPWDWVKREGYPMKVCESAMWNEIAFAAQGDGWGSHRKMALLHAPAMTIGEPVRPEVVAAYRLLARKHGYEIVETKDEHEWFRFRLTPVVWPPSMIGKASQLAMF